jgi:hypothetical protein
MDDGDPRQRIEIVALRFELQRRGVARCSILADFRMSESNGQNDGCDGAEHRTYRLAPQPTFRYMMPRDQADLSPTRGKIRRARPRVDGKLSRRGTVASMQSPLNE